MRPVVALLSARSVVFGLALLAAARASATPAQVIFLRHAEKPPVGAELDERGRQRAQALATLFTRDARVLEHGPIVAIFAMKPAKRGGSVRAIETMEPAARGLGVPIDASLTREEITALARRILATPAYDAKTVAVCWEHKMIPEMLKAFGWESGPAHWKDGTYDRLWLLDFEGAKAVRFRDLPQNLLPGDSKK